MSYNKWGPGGEERATAHDEVIFNAARRRNSGVAVDMPQYDADGFGQSRYENYMENKSADPYGNLTGKGIKSLSDSRQEQLHAMGSREEINPRANLGEAHLVKSDTLIKSASFGATTPVNISGKTNSTHIAPELYSPLFLTQNLQLPRDRITANAWNRAYYETNPIVRNCINLHATYPISKLSIKCEDKKKEQFYQDMIEKTDLATVVQHVGLEFWKLGEVIAYSNFDETSGMWDKIYLHNPDYISVKASPIPGVSTISLRPDPELEKIITSNDPAYAKIREQLDERVVHHVLQGEYIPLDSFNVSHLKHLSSPYDVRGTSIIVSCWKDLMLYDKLREAKFVQADGMINPITLIKVGASSPDGQYPRPEDLQAWREIIEEAQYDKDFKIVTHPDVSIERIGFSGQVIDVQQDFTMIIDNILMGMMVPKAIITQEGATYASASVALDVMRQRYNNFRTMMSNWLIQKIFAPIAEVNDFYRYEGGEKKLILPEIEWNQMTLYDLDSYIGHLMALNDKQPSATSRKTLFRSLGLNTKDENMNLREEAIDAAIAQREAAELSKLSLSELRALDPESPIVESPDSVLPGMPGGPGVPGGDPGLGMDGGGLPGLPDLGAPPGAPGLGDLAGPPGGAPPGGDLGGPPGGGGTPPGGPEGGGGLPPAV
jgi:hypothetical protein